MCVCVFVHTHTHTHTHKTLFNTLDTGQTKKFDPKKDPLNRPKLVGLSGSLKGLFLDTGETEKFDPKKDPLPQTPGK